MRIGKSLSGDTRESCSDEKVPVNSPNMFSPPSTVALQSRPRYKELGLRRGPRDATAVMAPANGIRAGSHRMRKAPDVKVAVVTGGGFGLGEATARKFAARGYHVVVAGRNLQRCREVVDGIGGLAVAADVTREPDVAALFETCAENFGRLDVLVNNAGGVLPWNRVEDIPTADWDRLFALNLGGVMLCTRQAVPLLKQKGGAIINIASRVGLRGIALQAAYSASKFAVVGFTEAMAAELGPYKIRVNALCPAAIRTKTLLARIAARTAEETGTVAGPWRAATRGSGAIEGLMEPDQVADAAVFLADASAITGAAIGMGPVLD